MFFFMDELKNLANVVIGKFREIGIAMMSPVAMLFHQAHEMTTSFSAFVQLTA
jgi:hypothetical protein